MLALGAAVPWGGVEVADPGPQVLVRDTKDREGPVLAFPPDAWRRFSGRVKAGTLPA